MNTLGEIGNPDHLTTGGGGYAFGLVVGVLVVVIGMFLGGAGCSFDPTNQRDLDTLAGMMVGALAVAMARIQ
jgi:hypothetical protein